LSLLSCSSATSTKGLPLFISYLGQHLNFSLFPDFSYFPSPEILISFSAVAFSSFLLYLTLGNYSFEFIYYLSKCMLSGPSGRL
jgi:hypothetical protein